MRRIAPRRLAAVAAVAALALSAFGSVGSSSALLLAGSALPENTFATAVLQPPGNLAAFATCPGPLQVRLTWEASPSGFADGYDLFRAQGAGPLAFLAHVTGASSTSHTDMTVKKGRTYRYAAVATAASWASAESPETTASVPRSC